MEPPEELPRDVRVGRTANGADPAPDREERLPLEPGEEERERYMRLLMGALESGSIDTVEYARRLELIEKARSEPELVSALGAAERDSRGRPPSPGPDAVDLALMSAAVSRRGGPRRAGRYLALVVVVLLLAVLVGMGIWLVSETKSTTSPGGALRTYHGLRAGYGSESAAPPPLSPRR